MSNALDKIAAGLADAIVYAQGDKTRGRDTRRAYYVHELPEEVIEALVATDFSHLDPKLDRLLD